MRGQRPRRRVRDERKGADVLNRLSDLDAAIVSAETSTQHLHVIATLLLDTSEVPPDTRYDRFRQRISERYALVEPMRRRLQASALGPLVWVDDPDMDLERHLHHAVVPGGGLDALARKASEVASHPLPRDRPLWEAWWVDGLDDARAGVIVKIHHGAVDGVSGFAALAAFFDLEQWPETQVIADWTPAAPPTPTELLQASLADGVRLGRSFVGTARRLATSGLAFARASTEASPMPLTGPRLSFNGALTPRRSVAFTRLAIDDVKRIRQAFDLTVNDVIVAIVTGALRRRLLAQDELPDRPLVAAIPTSEREPEHGLLGNHLSMMVYALPVHLEDPLARLAGVQESAAAAKAVYDAAGVGLMADVASVLPRPAVGPAMRLASALRLGDRVPPLVNVVVSSIRGPGFPLFAAGMGLESMFPIGPLTEGVGLGITAVSYRDEVSFGFLACPDLVPDVTLLVDDVQAELDVLVGHAEDAAG